MTCKSEQLREREREREGERERGKGREREAPAGFLFSMMLFIEQRPLVADVRSCSSNQ